jgi:hypothetical protein
MPRKSKKVKLLGGGMKADLLKEFIDLSYKGNTSIAPEGYDIDAPLSDSRVKVYQKKGSNQVIVTHRGSVGLQDWLDNAKFLVAGKVKSTKTYKLHRERHLKAVEKYGAENIIGIGHSRAGLYLQELQKEVPIKEIITYNKAVGFYDALRENPEEQTDVKVKNDFVSLLSGLQKRPNKMVEIDATSNPLDFNKAHQPAELEKLGDTFIGKKEETEGGKLTNPFYTPLPIVAADYIGRKTGLLGSGRAPSTKTIEQLKKMLKTLEGKLEKINKGKVYKTTNKDKVSYDISYTKARIANYETKGEDLIITKKKKYKDELPAKAKPYKAKEVKPKKEEPKPEPKKEEPKPEPKNEERTQEYWDREALKKSFSDNNSPPTLREKYTKIVKEQKLKGLKPASKLTYEELLDFLVTNAMKERKAFQEKRKEERKLEPPKLKKQKAFLLEPPKPEPPKPEPPKPEPPKPEPEPEPKKEEPKQKPKSKREPWSQSGICKKIMCAYGLRNKAQYKAWILKNHPDKGGTISNDDLVKILECANEKMFCKVKQAKPEKEEPPPPLLIKYEEPKIEMPKPEPTKKEIKPLINKLQKKIEEFEKVGREHGAVIYSASAFIQIVAYIALLIEYEAKCAIIGNKDLSNYAISSEENNLRNLLFYKKAREFSEDLLDCIKRGDNMIAIPLSLHLEKERLGHANMLIYRPYNKTIERFEPHGQTLNTRRAYSKTYNSILKRMFEVEMKPYLKEYTPKFISPEQICPVVKGFQVLESSLKGTNEEGGGFCGMWSLFVLELIFINPTLPTSEIIKIALDVSNKKPQYLKNLIRGYVLKTEKMLDSYIKKIDANDGFEFKTGKKLQRKKIILQEQLLNLLLSFNSEGARVKELKEVVKTNVQKVAETAPIRKFLLTKTSEDLTTMINAIFKVDIGKRGEDEVEDIVNWLIDNYLYPDEDDDDKDKYIDDIVKYYNTNLSNLIRGNYNTKVGGYFWESKETKDAKKEAKKAKREAREAEEKAKQEESRKKIGEVLTTFASKINEIKKQKKATTAQKAVDTEAIESMQQGVDEGQQGIEEGEPMAGAGFYLDKIAYPINPIYYSEYYDIIPSIIEPEDTFLIGGSFTDMAGMNCDKTTGECFNPVWEKQKIKRQILSEYKIWYWPWGAPPAGHIRMAWLEPMIQERYKPLYDEFVARRNVNIGLPPDASKDRFAQQMFSNLTDGLSYVPIFNTATSLGLSGVSALADTKKEDGT